MKFNDDTTKNYKNPEVESKHAGGMDVINSGLRAKLDSEEQLFYSQGVSPAWTCCVVQLIFKRRQDNRQGVQRDHMHNVNNDNTCVSAKVRVP